MEHIRTYIQSGSRKETSAAGQHRKYSSLSSFFNYYYKLGLIDQHPVHRVAAPKPPRHTTEVPTNEINYEMLDFVANGNLSGREANFREHTKERDLASFLIQMLTQFLLSQHAIFKPCFDEFGKCNSFVYSIYCFLFCHLFVVYVLC